MQQSTYYQLSEQEYGENPDVALLNGNMDVIDTALNKARLRDSDLYNENSEYAIGDFCIYNDALYKCTGATTGIWDATKWAQTSIAQAFEPKGTWELFETITADGNEYRYTRDIPANVSGFLLICYFKATTQTATHFRALLSSDGATYTAMAYMGTAVTSGDRYGRAEIIKDGNLWTGRATAATSAIGGSVNVTTLNNSWMLNETPTKIRLETTASTTKFESGSTFEIYIRR